MASKRWTPIAILALIALIAQPVAVLGSPSLSVGAASDDQPSTQCENPVPAESLEDVASTEALTHEADERLREACVTETAHTVVEDTTDEAKTTVDELAD